MANNFTAQEQAFARYVARGMHPVAAARAAGMPAVPPAERIADLVNTFPNNVNQHVVTRDLLNKMLFEAHAKAATASEEIAAIRELGKLNGLYEQADTTVKVEINSIKQLEELPDEKLIELAEFEELETLDP